MGKQPKRGGRPKFSNPDADDEEEKPREEQPQKANSRTCAVTGRERALAMAAHVFLSAAFMVKIITNDETAPSLELWV